MRNNTITVSVNYINGGYVTVLEGANPKDALEKYFYPDAGMPITLSIVAKTDNGKTIAFSINKNKISIIEDE